VRPPFLARFPAVLSAQRIVAIKELVEHNLEDLFE
jgi:hypothetical protein